MPVSNSFNGKRSNDIISADEAVAHGAAIRAAVLSSDAQELALLEVNTHSLGIFEVTLGINILKMISAPGEITEESDHVTINYKAHSGRGVWDGMGVMIKYTNERLP